MCSPWHGRAWHGPAPGPLGVDGAGHGVGGRSFEPLEGRGVAAPAGDVEEGIRYLHYDEGDDTGEDDGLGADI